MTTTPATTNDLLDLEPGLPSGGRRLELDFPDFEIGVAEYAAGPTGCTVFHFPAGAACAVDVRGGSAAVLGDYGWTHAVCLAGGSVYGLEAAIGVGAELFARREYGTRWPQLALVSGAIIFDFGRRQNAVYPDKALGRAALRAARSGVFPLGPRGAGCSAGVGKWSPGGRPEAAGQGGAFGRLGGIRIAVFSVVNALGSIVDRQGRVVRGSLDGDGRRAPAPELARLGTDTPGGRPPGAAAPEAAPHARPAPAGPPPAEAEAPSPNTTLTVMVTDQRLDLRTLRQVGRQVHASMARAIQPFHCLEDGDVLFALTTATADDPEVTPSALGVVASELAWDAVLTCWQA